MLPKCWQSVLELESEDNETRHEHVAHAIHPTRMLIGRPPQRVSGWKPLMAPAAALSSSLAPIEPKGFDPRFLNKEALCVGNGVSRGASLIRCAYLGCVVRLVAYDNTLFADLRGHGTVWCIEMGVDYNVDT